MSFAFYLKTALRNINNNKRQSLVFIFSILMPISLLIAIDLWSSTAEDLAVSDFLNEQDFEMRVNSAFPDELSEITHWLESDPLVYDTYDLITNHACFNAEDKPLNYRWSPENAQENMSDPISYTSLGLFPKKVMNRIKTQFSVRGSFDLELGECLISEVEALELESIYGYPIEPGMNFTLSVARNSPDLGEVFIHQLQLKHYQNVTIKGIYQPIPSISMLQNTYSSTFLRDSVLFLSENLDNITLLEMDVNGIDPIILVKMNVEKLKEDGVNQILNKIYDLTDRLEVRYIFSQNEILESPTKELELSYSIAKTASIYILPVVAVSIILALFTNDIILEKRRLQFTTLKDRGGQNWQVILIILIEFFVLLLVGLLIGIAFSFILSAFIPTLASGSFSGVTFRLFIRNSIYPLTLTLYASLSAFIIIGVYTVVKSQIMLVNNIEERIQKRRNNLKNITIILVLLTIFSFTIGFLLKNIIENQRDTQGVYNFNVDQARKSMNIFLMITILILIFIVVISILYNNYLGKPKLVYKKIFSKNSFFVSNSLNQSRNKLSKLLVVFVLLCSVNVFSLNLYSTLKTNEEAVSYYNNGSDLRIHTSFVDINYIDNITEINGINQITPLLRTSGRLVYNSATVYGLDPNVYSQIGRWDYSNQSQSEITSMMYNLSQVRNGAIISNYLASRLPNITIGSLVTVSDLPNSSTYVQFVVQGIITSAPGLGLSYGINIELNQPNQEFLIINQNTMVEDLGVRDTNIFFASLEDENSLEQVENELLELGDVIDVNPEIINPQFVGKYISQYIPNVRVFLFVQLLLTNLIGLVIIALTIAFILRQRDQDNAILTVMGNSNNNLLRMVSLELVIILIAAILAALLLGTPFSYVSSKVNRPSFYAHIILPIEFSFNYIGILIFVVVLVALSLIVIIPLVKRFSKKNLATILHT
jgi:ABC-type antimicrobial peptide transport system permease subunit